MPQNQFPMQLFLVPIQAVKDGAGGTCCGCCRAAGFQHRGRERGRGGEAGPRGGPLGAPPRSARVPLDPAVSSKNQLPGSREKLARGRLRTKVRTRAFAPQFTQVSGNGKTEWHCARSACASAGLRHPEVAFVSALCAALERVGRIELRRLRSAPETWHRNWRRHWLRRACRLGPRTLRLSATIRVGGRTSAGCGRQGLSQPLEGVLPEAGQDTGIRCRLPTIPGCLRSRSVRPCNRREGVSLQGCTHRLLAAYRR